MKKPNVVPISKKVNESDMSHYALISLTAVVGELCEFIIARNLSDHYRETLPDEWLPARVHLG